MRSYVKLSFAVVDILVGKPGPSKDLSTKVWLHLAQEFQIKRFLEYITSIFLCKNCHLGRRAGMPDKILKGGHQRTIPTKFGANELSGCREEDFFVIVD